MELYILSKEDLSILSVCKLADYEINLDEETNAKSTFTLMKVNGLKKGNFMVLNGLYKQFLFIIDEINTEKGSGVATVTALDISNIFDRKVIEKNINTMKNKSIEEFIANTISENFVNSDDIALNVGYIDTYWHTNTKSSVDTNAENGLYNFHTFLTNCRQYKNIYSDFKVENIGKPQALKGKELTVQARNRKVLDISLHGETSQATRSGKNIFNKKAKIIENGVTKSVLDTGVRITQTHAGQYRYGCIRLGGSEILGKTLRISSNWTKSADNVPYIAVYLGNSSSMVLYSLFGTGVSGQIRQITIPNAFPAVGEQVCDTVYILLYSNRDGTGNVGDYVDYTDLIVTVDNDDMTYEDYGASPSPDYPSEIGNVEGKNKFDINQEKEIFGIMLYKYSYYLKPNTKYTISSNCPASTTANIYANSNSSKSAVYINKNQTIQSDENGYFYILVRFKADASDNSTFNLYEKVLNGTYYIQLEEGTVATDYVPYNSLEIKNVGENLFNPSNAKDGYVSDRNGQIIGVNIKNKNTGYIKIDGEEKYFILSNKLTGNWGAWYDKDKKFISGITLGGKNKGIVTAPNNAYFINFTVSYENNNPDYANNVMIARSDKEIPYKPYQEQKSTFPLSEGQKLMEVSYLASDGIHHKRKQYVITGNETIEKIWIDDDTHHVFAIKASLPVPQISDKTYKEYLCNTYRVLNYDGGIDSIWANRKDNNTNYTTAMAIDYANSSLSLRGRIIIKDMSIDDIDKMKTYLSEQYSNGTPVIVEYEPSEEEIVPYTEAQQEAWDKLQNLMLYEGINHISSNANMVLSYYPLNPIGIKLILRIDIENKVEETKLIDTTLPEVTDYNKIYEEDVTAKVQVYIREDGSEYNLYLKTDRTTTTNKDDPNRLSGKIEVISVDTADKAAEEALNVMKGNRYKHLVEFKIAKTSKLMDITQLYIRKTS